MPEQVDWEFVDFTDRVDRWVAEDGPSPDLRLFVIDRILSRATDPYLGVRRSPDAADLWFCRVPHPVEEPGRAVLASYRIDEVGHRVVCDGLATLGLPS